MNENEDWNEFHQSEKSALQVLRKLGYTIYEGDPNDKYVDKANLVLAEDERDSPKQVVLEKRLAAAIKRINPWIDEHNAARVVRRFTTIPAVGLIEANEKVYRDLVQSISIEQNVGTGQKKHQTVNIIDFDTSENNEFMAVRQFKVWGAKENIKPDIVLFINGLPICVIECKSPTINEPIEKAVHDNLRRYPDKIMGVPPLFYYNQVLIATCGLRAESATVGAQRQHYHEWKDAWPFTTEKIEKEIGRKPTSQDLLFFGMLSKQHFLDLIQNFIVYEPENGVLVKKLARYQQFRTVNKALDRIRKAKTQKERGGIVWHWQGSGKSLSMLWLAMKLRRERGLNNPTMLVVTDRVNLDRQICGTFERCGFPNPQHAMGSENLRDMLKAGPGQTIMTTVQKFLTREGEKKGEFPLLSSAKDIFVLVDEAHRTQYKELAANMRQALPNACYVGFTGTPIDKKDRSTPATFGSYIDKYSMKDSNDDKATVPIFYESRLPKLHVEGESLDAIFDRVFGELSPEQKREVKKKYANLAAITGAPKRIEKVCLDILEHYEKFIRPNGFKAQIVAIDRRTAVLYKKTLDRLRGPRCEVIISPDPVISDEPEDKDDILLYRKSQQERDVIEARFKLPMDKDDLSILIVNEMLLTGFDAPIEQVMYLDNQLREHNLLQAIARVNRPYAKKEYGLVVDYFGVSDNLGKALEIFNEVDVAGALRPIKDMLPTLQARHRKAMSFFEHVDRNDLEACTSVLEPEKTRREFEAAFRLFAQSMDILMPNPEANPYREDLKNLGKIRDVARLRFRDPQLGLSEYGNKVRKLIEEHIRATGVDPLLNPISILDRDFKKKVGELTSDKAKASEMEHALRYELEVRREENPVYYDSLKERLEKLIRERDAKRMEMAQLLLGLSQITEDVRNIKSKAERLGLNDFEFSMYEIFEKDEVNEETGKALSQKVYKELDRLLVVDWASKNDIQREARRTIKRILRTNGMIEEKIDVLVLQIMDLARVHIKK